MEIERFSFILFYFLVFLNVILYCDIFILIQDIARR